MKLKLLLETVDDQLREVASRYDVSTDDIRKACQIVDPKFWKWVLKIWYQKEVDPQDIDSALSTETGPLKKLKSLLAEFKAYSKDIYTVDLGRIKSIEDLKTAIADIKNKLEDRYGKGAELIKAANFDSVLYLAYAITDESALEEIGEGSSWCTRRSYKPCRAKYYLDTHRVMYVILKDFKPFLQFTPTLSEITDAKNSRITSTSLRSVLTVIGISLDEILSHDYASIMRKRINMQIGSEEGISPTAIYALIQSVEEGEYESILEPSIIKLLAHKLVLRDIRQRENISFLQSLNVLIKSDRRLPKIIITHTNDLIKYICEFIENRYWSLSSRFRRDSDRNIAAGEYDVLAWPDLKNIITLYDHRRDSLSNPAPVSQLAATYYRYIGKYVDDPDSLKQIQEQAILSMDGVLSLADSERTRIPAVEQKLLDLIAYDIEEGDTGNASYDNLIAYYEAVMGTKNIDVNHNEFRDHIKSFKRDYQYGRWQEYEDALMSYNIKDIPIGFNDLSKAIDAITVYMVMNQMTLDDWPQVKNFILDKTKMLFDSYVNDGAGISLRGGFGAEYLVSLKSFYNLVAGETQGGLTLDIIDLWKSYNQYFSGQGLQYAIDYITTKGLYKSLSS